MKASWKTTVGGILAAIGTAMQAIESLRLWGAAIGAIGVAILGMAARDNGVSSEAAGVKPPDPPQP
jgi:hypothetical protein